MTEKTLRQTLNYQPVASAFGTSGVRALVSDLTDLEVYSLTLGALRYLDRQGALGPAQSVPIPLGLDLRPSSERIARAVARAIIDASYQFDYLGALPTPALTLYALSRNIASFMITGSHIPADRNGMKTNRRDGEVMKSDEPGIVEAVERVRQELYDTSAKASPFDPSGGLKRGKQPILPPANSAAADEYRERYQQIFPRQELARKRVLFYQYCAVGRDQLPDMVRDCGAEVITIGRSEQFTPIDTEAISQEHLNLFRALVTAARKEHGRIDALISTDGDSDRPLVIGINEKAPAERLSDWASALLALPGDLIRGNNARQQFRRRASPVSLRFIPGDLLGVVVADYLKADAIATPISASPAINEWFDARRVPVLKTRIGSPYVIEAMGELLREGYQRVVSWEANGGFLVGSDLTLSGGCVLKALPTRDAILPILCLLHSAAERSKTVPERLDELPHWCGAAGLIDNFPQAISRAIVAAFRPDEAEAEWIEFTADQVIIHASDQRILADYPLDDPRAESLVQKRARLEAIFTPADGFNAIARINALDGVRCHFANGEIAHIRPSGNAPQLRFYAHSRAQTRSDAMVALAVAEPDGLLRRLAELVKAK